MLCRKEAGASQLWLLVPVEEHRCGAARFHFSGPSGNTDFYIKILKSPVFTPHQLIPPKY